MFKTDRWHKHRQCARLQPRLSLDPPPTSRPCTHAPAHTPDGSPHTTPTHTTTPPPRLPPCRLPPGLVPRVNGLNEIWVPSPFSRDVFIRSGREGGGEGLGRGRGRTGEGEDGGGLYKGLNDIQFHSCPSSSPSPDIASLFHTAAPTLSKPLLCPRSAPGRVCPRPSSGWCPRASTPPTSTPPAGPPCTCPRCAHGAQGLSSVGTRGAHPLGVQGSAHQGQYCGASVVFSSARRASGLPPHPSLAICSSS